MGNFGFGFVVAFVATIVILKLLDDDESWVVEVPMEPMTAVVPEPSLNQAGIGTK